MQRKKVYFSIRSCPNLQRATETLSSPHRLTHRDKKNIKITLESPLNLLLSASFVYVFFTLLQITAIFEPVLLVAHSVQIK